MDEFDPVASGDFGSFSSGDLPLSARILDMVGSFRECVYVYGGGVGGAPSKSGSEHGFSVPGHSIKSTHMSDPSSAKITRAEFLPQ